MWFQQKPKNRRLNRDHVLDVKMHSQHVRMARARRASQAFAGILGTALILFLGWRGSEWAMNEFVFRNPMFNLREMAIQTDGIIPPPQIQAWAGIKPGDNLFTLDLPRIERDLELQPFIEQAFVVRVLPHTLKIRIVEREPVAQISGFRRNPSDGEVKQTIFCIDQAGYVLPPLELPGHPAAPEALPVLTGISGTELRPGRRIELPQMHAALKLITVFDRSPMAGLVDLQSLDLSSPQVLRVSTRQGNEITFPLDAHDRALRRWRAVHDFAKQIGKSIATLDLSVANNSPALWHQAGVAPTVPPKPIKPSRYRKKHA